MVIQFQLAYLCSTCDIKSSSTSWGRMDYRMFVCLFFRDKVKEQNKISRNVSKSNLFQAMLWCSTCLTRWSNRRRRSSRPRTTAPPPPPPPPATTTTTLPRRRRPRGATNPASPPFQVNQTEEIVSFFVIMINFITWLGSKTNNIVDLPQPYLGIILLPSLEI